MIRACEGLFKANSLGFYNCCEVTTIFLFNKKKKQTVNVFTMFSMEERVDTEFRSGFLTPSLLGVTKDCSLGISQRVIQLDDAEECLRKLQKVDGKRSIDIGEGELVVGKLEVVPPVFVPKDSTREIPMNKVMKNNFKNGSYVLEFFETEKLVDQWLDKRSQKKMLESIIQYVPVDLVTISDRVGNFLFQFPSLCAEVSYEMGDSEADLYYHVKVDERLENKINWQLVSEIMHDDIVIGFGTMDITELNTKQHLYVGDTSKMCRTMLIDKEKQWILSSQDTSFMKQAVIHAHIGSQFGEQRIIYDTDGKVKATVDVFTEETMRIGDVESSERERRIENRKYRLRMDELERRKELLQYGTKKSPEREKALHDIRELMGRSGIQKVYLWDPYLSAQDLLDTFYFTTTLGIELRAITSQNAKKDCDNVKEWIEAERQVLQKGSNHYGICLEFRCQWRGQGYSFHDRFLMLVYDEGKPQVWSLGASINSIGKNHHIIQKVSDPQIIVDAFEELWEMLSAEECLVWKCGK